MQTKILAMLTEDNPFAGNPLYEPFLELAELASEGRSDADDVKAGRAIIDDDRGLYFYVYRAGRYVFVYNGNLNDNFVGLMLSDDWNALVAEARKK